MSPGFRFLASALVVAGSVQAGILVTRSDKGLQFTNIASISVQGKDKALSLGSEPKLNGPVNKLPSVTLAQTLLKDADSKTLAAYDGSSLEFLLPTGLPKTATGDPAMLWQSARLAYKKASSDKTPTEVPIAEVLAVLPEGLEQLRRIVTDARALEVLGGKGRGFAAQVEWLSAAVKAFPSEPALAPLEKYVEQSMRQRLDVFESGGGGVDLLEQGLKFAELSQAAYPDRPEQDRLRKALAARKAWVERRVAVLKAFAASEQWDAFLLGAREFETYEQAFPDIVKLRAEAMKQSFQLHRKAGHDRSTEGEFGAAFREYRIASLRQPSDAVLVEETREAWTEYSRRTAVDRQGRREHLSAGQHDAVERDLYFADQNKQSKNLDEALNNVLHAESVLHKTLPPEGTAPESLRVLYKKAEILGAQGKISEALGALDQYDLEAVDDERQPANQLRNQLLFALDKTLSDIKAQIQKAWPQGRFHQVRRLAEQGLQVKEDDPEMLYYAGVAALVTRDRKQSRTLLTRYLQVSNTLEGSAEQRARVRRLLPGLAAETPAPSSSGAAGAPPGEINWMSGAVLARGTFYCPLSLAFQPRIERIDASNKMKTAFDWNGAKLKSITPTFEKIDQATGEKPINFAYDDRVPQVVSVGFDQPAPAPPSDPDEILQRAALVLWNNPYLDPVAAGALTGVNVTLGFAGNRFFNPFIWEKIYPFRFTYDSQGRVVQAREIADAKGTPGNLVVEFEWDGQQLTAVRGYEGTDPRTRAAIYERTLQYESGRLMGEQIQSQGRLGRIKYVYKGDKLVSASCDKNTGLDNRSRQVTFAGN